MKKKNPTWTSGAGASSSPHLHPRLEDAGWFPNFPRVTSEARDVTRPPDATYRFKVRGELPRSKFTQGESRFLWYKKNKKHSMSTVLDKNTYVTLHTKYGIYISQIILF